MSHGIGSSQSFWQQDQASWPQNQTNSSIAATDAVMGAMSSAEANLGKGLASIANSSGAEAGQHATLAGNPEYPVGQYGAAAIVHHLLVDCHDNRACCSHRNRNEIAFGKHPAVTSRGS